MKNASYVVALLLVLLAPQLMGAVAPPAPETAHSSHLRWFEGTLSYRGDTTTLRLEIDASPNGVQARLDLPELVYAGQPIEATGALHALSLELPFGLGAFEIDAGLHEQTLRKPLGNHELVLRLSRSLEPAITTRTIRFHSRDIQLESTVLLPPGPGPHPALVLAHGAGAVGRENWSYASWADFYIREGFAVLLYDKRGVGKSGGDTWDADLEVLADDLEAAVETLGGLKTIDRERIGIHGSSQGAWVATLVAARNDLVSFLVLSAPPAMDPLSQKQVRVEHELRAGGFSDEEVAAALEYMALYAEVVRSGENWPALAAASSRASAAPWGEHVFQPTEEAHLDWYRDNFSVDPIPLWRELDIPVLALFGTRDLIVPPAVHAPLLREAFGKQAQVHIYEDADHRLETPLGERNGNWYWFRIAPGLLDDLRDWLRRMVAAPAPVRSWAPRADDDTGVRTRSPAPPAPG